MVPLRLLLCVLLIACGRIGFDPDDGGSTNPTGDALAVGCDVTHPNAQFCDGFEDPALVAWDYFIENDGTTARSLVRAYRGSASLYTQIFNVATYKAARRGVNLFPGLVAGDLYVRAFYWIPASSQITDQLSIMVTGNNIDPFPSANVLLVPGEIHLNVEVSGTFGALNFPHDRWTCVELHIVIDPAGGVIEAWVDGMLRATGSDLDTEVAGGYTNVDIGVHYATPAQAPAEMWVDEVVVDLTPIGCN